jgi:purine-binding chemotaxis protein CheW
MSTSEIEAGRAAQLLCKTGRQYHAIPINDVIEIMRALPIEPIAGAPSYVSGLSVVRGAPVPVVDVGLLIHGQATRSGRLVALKAGQRLIALHVEAVIGIRAFDSDTFDLLPPLLRDAAADSIATVAALDAELLFTLNAARMVPDDVFEGLARVGDAL